MRLIATVMLFAAPALALERVSNSFWNTTGYTGVAPAVSETAALACELDSWTTRKRIVGPLDTPFSSFPTGFTIIFR